MMEANQNASAFDHAVAEELPRSVLFIVRYISDRLCARVYRLD
jgi:hypothetical protein